MRALWIQSIAIYILLCSNSLIAEDWPHWRGTSRNGVIQEDSGWDNGSWQTLDVAWKHSIGEGATSPIVAKGRLYTMGWRDGQDDLQCLNSTTGKLIWSKSYQAPKHGRYAVGDQGLYSGPTSTPEYDLATGMLYTLGVDGDLKCWDTNQNGKLIWSKNLYDDFDIPTRPMVGRSGRRDYGYTSSPLVHENSVIVEVGSSTGTLIAFDKLTGEKLWASTATDPAGHTGGPVPMEIEGIPCVAVHTYTGLLIVRLDNGQQGVTVATYPWKTNFANNISTLAVLKNNVVLTSAYNQHKITRLQISLTSVVKIWEQEFASKVCSPIISDGYIYWAWQNMMCLNFKTGQLEWRGGQVGDAGSCILTADNRLIVWSGRGDLTLVEPHQRSPDQFLALAKHRVLSRADAWPHIVVANGHLYCKDRNGTLVCIRLT